MDHNAPEEGTKPFITNILFLYPLKTSERVEKGYNGNKWVKNNLSLLCILVSIDNELTGDANFNKWIWRRRSVNEMTRWQFAQSVASQIKSNTFRANFNQ